MSNDERFEMTAQDTGNRADAIGELLMACMAPNSAIVWAAAEGFRYADADGFLTSALVDRIFEEVALCGRATADDMCREGFWQEFNEPAGKRYRVSHWWLRERRHAYPPSHVYVVEAGPGGPIKVGCSKDVDSRVASLQTGNAHALRILLTIPGGRTMEGMIHQRFAHLRMNGEWFRRAPDLLEFIRELGGRE